MREPVYVFVYAVGLHDRVPGLLKTLLEAEEEGLVDEVLIIDLKARKKDPKEVVRDGVTVRYMEKPLSLELAFKDALDYFIGLRAQLNDVRVDGVLLMMDAGARMTLQQLGFFLKQIVSLKSAYMITSSSVKALMAVRLNVLRPLHQDDVAWNRFLEGEVPFSGILSKVIPSRRDLFTLPLAVGESVSSWNLVNTLNEMGFQGLGTRLDGSIILRETGSWDLIGVDGDHLGSIRDDGNVCRLIVGEKELTFLGEERINMVKDQSDGSLVEVKEYVAYTPTVREVMLADH
ncbi:hypothetical protein ACFLRF_01210 [Candidatus Altiarchaeota archaeon]